MAEVEQTSEPVAEPTPAPEALPVETAQPAEVEAPAPGPDASVLDEYRVTAHFEYQHLGDILADLVLDTGIVLFSELGPIISPIYFEDEPLRLCLDRLAHLVTGSYEYSPAQGLHFKVN